MSIGYITSIIILEMRILIMQKNNNLTTIIIVILALLAGAFGGYWLSNMLTEKKQENNVTDNNTNDTNNNSDSDIENNEQINFTLNDAKDLMSNYITIMHGNDVCGMYYFSDLSNENGKNYLALSNVEETKYISCKEDIGDNTDGNRYDCGDGWQPWIYPYEDVLAAKKMLFGDNSTLVKETISGPSYYDYEYFENHDAFVYTGSFGGGDCGEHEYFVDDFKMQNDTLYIYTSGRFGIGYDEKEIKNKFTFKKQDTGYYMTAVEEIK